MAKHRVIELTANDVIRFWEKVDKSGSCWVWKSYRNRQGYGRFGIGSGKCVNAHRVSYTITHGKIPDGYFVCHKCDNTSCVRPDHLFVGTRQDNIDDMMIKKRARHFRNHQYYGVVWDDRKYEGGSKIGRWRSVVCVDGRMKKLGAHTSLLEAARNYDRIAYIVYGERDRLNFPEEYNINHWK